MAQQEQNRHEFHPPTVNDITVISWGLVFPYRPIHRESTREIQPFSVYTTAGFIDKLASRISRNSELGSTSYVILQKPVDVVRKK
jgi:hypothetical protein